MILVSVLLRSWLRSMAEVPILENSVHKNTTVKSLQVTGDTVWTVWFKELKVTRSKTNSPS